MPILSGLRLLVVEDEALQRRALVAALEDFGADVTAVDRLAGARIELKQTDFDFALVDVNLPDGLGPDLLGEGIFPTSTGVVVMTAEGGVGGAVKAIQAGALDYLLKPFDPQVLALTLVRARKNRSAGRAAEKRQQEIQDDLFFFGSALASLQQQLQKIVAADSRMQGSGAGLSPVLILGETGTGKTTLARWLHQNGPRATAPLVEVNCSAIPDHLAESELFGHEKGAFTDARATRLGLFEAAHTGTLFLDELASLSVALQAKILTVLESRKIRRVGGNKEIAVDVRIIAAANRDLRAEATAGRFREDLLHRLDLFRLSIPPLRSRGSDMTHLAEKILEQLGKRHRLEGRSLSADGVRRLLAYPWPGNVRELRHELERALVFEEGPSLHLEQLMGVGGGAATSTDSKMNPAPIDSNDDWLVANYRFPKSGFSLEDAILRLIGKALEQSGGNVSSAARLLGVSRDYIRYRSEKKTE